MGYLSMKVPGRVGYQCSAYWRQMMKDGWVEDPNYVKKNGKWAFKRAAKGTIPDSLRQFSFTVLHDPSGVFAPIPASHPKKPSDAQLARYLSKGCRTQNSKKPAKGGKGKKGKKGKAVEVKDGEKAPPKKPQSAYFLFAASVREQIKTEFPNKKVTEIAKETGSRWKAMSKEQKQPFNAQAIEAKEEYVVKMEEYLKEEDKREAEKKAQTEEKDENSEEVSEKKKTTKMKKSTKKSKSSKKKKRKHDGAVDDTEPNSKKRKVDAKDDALMSIFEGMTDLMTGERLQKPAISPYGHVMEYSSWCSILRQTKTKNKCPFTQNTLTRRSLVKLDADNIEEYKEKIVNV